MELIKKFKVNLNKLLNYFSYVLKLEKSLGKPYLRVIEPTNACMMKCIMCPRKNMARKVEYMELDFFKKIIDQAKWNKTIDFSHFGDPLMHPKIDKMIEYANSKGIKTYIYANPNMLSKEMCAKLIKAKLHVLETTIDGINDKTYKNIRGPNADFKKAMKNINTLLRLKKEKNSDIKILISMIKMDKNKDNVETFKKIWNKEGIVRTNIKELGFFDGSDKEIFKHSIKKFEKGKEVCGEPWKGFVITAGGKAVPCCFDYDEKYILGDIKKESLRDIWNGKRMRELRRLFKNNTVSNVSLCRTCIERPPIDILKIIKSKIKDLNGDII